MKSLMNEWREYRDSVLNENVLLRDQKKYTELVADAYQARPSKEKEMVKSYESLVEDLNKNYSKLRKKFDVKVLTSSEKKYSYRDAEDMRDRIEESGVILVEDEDTGRHPLLNKKHQCACKAIHDYLVHGVAEKSFNPKNKLQGYSLHANLISEDSKPALFTEIVGPLSVQIAKGKKPERKRACKLFGFDYNKVGRVNQQEYQKNFMEEYGGPGLQKGKE